MNYTKEQHVENLLKLLSMPYPCESCPDPNIGSFTTMGYVLGRCRICREFVGLLEPWNRARCPCSVLGPHESIKRTWSALEEGGYLDG